MVTFTADESRSSACYIDFTFLASFSESKVRSLTTALIYLLCVFCHALPGSSPHSLTRFTDAKNWTIQPYGTETNTTDEGAYIAASYVKFVEMAGARAVPVFHNGTEAYLNDTFYSINGLVMPGGGSNISSGTQLHGAAEFLYNLTLEANQHGDTFPIWGTCMG